MKNERHPTFELNMLSAYLDNELSADAREILESRLEKEPELAARFQKLRRTKVLISQLDRYPAPRNFTLTPDMVKVRQSKRKPLFTFLQLASSLSAILLVVLFGLERLTGGFLTGQPQMASDAIMEFASIAEETDPDPLIIWGEPGIPAGNREGDVRGLGGGELMAEDPVGSMKFEVSELEQEEQATPLDAPVTDSTQPTEESVEIFREEKQSGDEKTIILGINPDQGGEIVSQSPIPAPTEESPIRRWNPIQWLQVGLAIIAAGSGLLLWFLRRKHAARSR